GNSGGLRRRCVSRTRMSLRRPSGHGRAESFVPHRPQSNLDPKGLVRPPARRPLRAYPPGKPQSSTNSGIFERASS
ncbi:MAG: hypothetical protein ACK55I_31200, partial [bacterium]